MKNFKSHFKFNKQERSGIFFLLLIIFFLQIGYFLYRISANNEAEYSVSLDTEMQAQMDILKEKVLLKDSIKIYPFNPNFITDYKGYALGMSTKEIDRLHTFRKQDEYVNSAKEFQEVTLVSDSLLNSISPYFKFPNWTNKRNNAVNNNVNYNKTKTSEPFRNSTKPKNVPVNDLNAVTAEELKSINGIGEKLSTRIIKFRDRLGGFLVDEQLYDVYYLEPEVAKRVLTKFKVFNKPTIQKIDINNASASEISSLVYISYDVAKNIVSQRDANGPFSSLNELRNIDGFPSDKITRIALYLSL